MRLYGIKFGFENSDNKGDVPLEARESRMNIYFKDIKEAAKVTKFLREKDKNKYFTLYTASLETLEKFKNHDDVAGYKIFDKAEDYFETYNKNHLKGGLNK